MVLDRDACKVRKFNEMLDAIVVMLLQTQGEGRRVGNFLFLSFPQISIIYDLMCVSIYTRIYICSYEVNSSLILLNMKLYVVF